MRTKSLLALVVAVAMLFTITGCNEQPKKDPIIGSWAQGSWVYTFNEDKTCSYEYSGSKMECTYEIDGENLSILYKGNTTPFKTTFKIENNKLTIKDSLDKDVVYEKK